MTALQRNSSNKMYEETVQNKRIGYHHNASEHVSADPYSSFTLVDNLTLNSIKLHHKKPRKYKNFQPPLEEKMQKCLDLLTFTKKFQLSSVQEKNYKKIISKQENAKTISIKKNNSFKPSIARKKQGPITKLEKQELRRYLSGEIENVDPKIINNPSKNTKHSSLFSVNKLAQKKPTKLKSITNNTQNRNSQESSQKKITEKTGKYQKLEKYIDEEVFPSLSKQIKIALMENNEYLVVPKDMNKPRFNHKKSAYHEKKNEIKFSEKDYHISQLKFEKSKETPLIKNLKNKQTINEENEGKKLHTGRERIFDSIKKGEYFKVEIELSVDPSLLLCQDDKSNNLLHHCILQNKPQLFDMILKKSTQHKIDLITMKNKFRRSPYELGHLMDFFHKNDMNLMVESIYKHSKLKVAYELFSIIP